MNAGEPVLVEYYCPVHGTVVVDYHAKAKLSKPRR